VHRLPLPPFRVLGLALLITACGSDPDVSGADDTTGADGPAGDVLTAEEAGPVVDNYAGLVFSSYEQTRIDAEALRAAVSAFVADPTPATHDAAKAAWLTARESYGQTEAFRFYDGPIDDADGPEGQINAWPMDEAYVDYVQDAPDAGIVNDPSLEISKQMLADLNEVGGEENVATGYHAIEFLLWGQDLDDAGPGTRSHEDYLDDGPRPNTDRRRAYLQAVADLLVDDLTFVAAAWDPADTTAFRSTFVALPPHEAVQNMMRGMGALASAELAEERMNVAFDTKLQEDEHSCFSDNTHNDILYNFRSVQNVYFGDAGAHTGPGVDTLIEGRDPELAAALASQFAATEQLIMAIPAPFDQAIQGQDTDPGRVAVGAAIDALRDLGDRLVEAAAVLDVTLNVGLE
jgi:putative iron-regulated protein